MEYANVLRHFGTLGSFDLPGLLSFTGEKKATVLQTLYRWNQKGWIIPLRRGLYTFPPELTKNPLTAERAANQIQPHSYVTGRWLLNQLGLVQESVTVVTNATKGNPAEFQTRIGWFAYQHIQSRGFFGYESRPDACGMEVRVATPEKALLDFFWWENIEWNESEFARWRIQDPHRIISLPRLREFATQWNQPRLIRAVQQLSRYLRSSGSLAPIHPISQPAAMNRETEEKLVDFVARQHRDFDPAQWLGESRPAEATALELATVAHFLALTTFDHQVPLPAWAKQKETLLRVAEQLDPGARGSFHTRMKETGFQPDRFANMLSATLEHQPQPA